MNQRLLDRICDCPDLPSLPAIALRIMDLTQRADVTPQQVADLISQDPALSFKLLRTVNSSFYGCSQAISSISGAVVMLGMESVRTLALGFSIVATLKAHKSDGFDHVIYWRRSLYAAIAARVLGAKVWVTEKEACFLAALLMDVGMLVMDKLLGDAYAHCVAKTRNHAELLAAEDAAFDLNHQQVAGFMAERWKLPEVLAVPMANHHTPQRVEALHTRTYVDVVALAARCADVFVDRQPMWSIADVRRICAEQLHITEIDCDSMLVEIGMRTKQLAPLFEVKVDRDASYEKILARANAQLIDVTRLAAEEDENADRRRAPRIKRNREVTILPCSGGVVRGSIAVRLQDVSARGVGFLHTASLDVGSQFILRVPRADGVSTTLLYTIVRCVPAGADGNFTIGGQLDCVLREDGLAPPAKDGGDVRAA